MGPQPRGRGILGTRPHANGSVSLQWGRDRPVAELDGVAHHPAPLLRASMGPRPPGRGIGGIFASHPSLHAASMGPRPPGRGIAIGNTKAGVILVASMGPRPPGRGIPDARVPEGPQSPCFNGAATARSRNFREKCQHENVATALQWGRDRPVAEFQAIAGLCFPGVSLQWGRDRPVAELVVAQAWARRQSVASMGPRPPGRGIRNGGREGPRGNHRFNGAATARSRNSGSSSIQLLTAVSFNGAATARSRNCLESRRMRRCLGLLQWGRDRPVAELRRRATRCLGPPCFNGAATARSRNYGSRSATEGPSVASMGPRPPGRGIGWASIPYKQNSQASMGPRPPGRGIAPETLAAQAISSASMGPRPPGRGIKAADEAESRAGALQWGRDRPVAELTTMTTTARSWIGFNGAATARSRNFVHCRRFDRELVASMGPRPPGRGISRRLSIGSLD